MNWNNISKLYDFLDSNAVSNIGTREEFANRMNSRSDREKLYRFLIENGVTNMGGDIDEFEAKLGFQPTTSNPDTRFNLTPYDITKKALKGNRSTPEDTPKKEEVEPVQVSTAPTILDFERGTASAVMEHNAEGVKKRLEEAKKPLADAKPQGVEGFTQAWNERNAVGKMATRNPISNGSESIFTNIEKGNIGRDEYAYLNGQRKQAVDRVDAILSEAKRLVAENPDKYYTTVKMQMTGGGGLQEQMMPTNDGRVLFSVIDKLEETKRHYERAVSKADKNIGKADNALKAGLGEVDLINVLTAGWKDTLRDLNLAGIVTKENRGEMLTPEENLYLKLSQEESNLEDILNMEGGTTGWYIVGKGLADSAPYLTGMGMTSGIAAPIKASAEGLIKTTANRGLKQFLQKGTSKLIGSAAAAAATTPLQAGMWDNYAKNTINEWMEYGGIHSSKANRMWKGFADAFTDVFTEHLGGLLTQSFKYAFPKIGVEAVLARFGVKNNFAKDMLKGVGWTGSFGEFEEEILAGILSPIIRGASKGERQQGYKELFNKENLWTTLMTTALMGAGFGVMQAPEAGIQIAKYSNARRKANNNLKNIRDLDLRQQVYDALQLPTMKETAEALSKINWGARNLEESDIGYAVDYVYNSMKKGVMEGAYIAEEANKALAVERASLNAVQRNGVVQTANVDGQPVYLLGDVMPDSPNAPIVIVRMDGTREQVPMSAVKDVAQTSVDDVIATLFADKVAEVQQQEAVDSKAQDIEDAREAGVTPAEDTQAEELVEGDIVVVNGEEGEIIALDPNAGRARVMVGNKSVEVAISDLQPATSESASVVAPPTEQTAPPTEQTAPPAEQTTENANTNDTPATPQKIEPIRGKDGKVDYNAMGEEQTATYVGQTLGERALGWVERQIASRQRALKKEQEEKALPLDIDEAQKAIANQQANIERLQQEIKMWEGVKARLTAPTTEEVVPDATAEQPKPIVDKQGNPIDKDGRILVETVESIDDITDEDFESPTRSIQLPVLPANVNDAIGANGKPVIIKKNIFERNAVSHSDLTPEQSRQILKSALYSPELYGQNQKKRKPYNWVVISVQDSNMPNRLVLLEVNEGKDNVEIVHWHYIDQRGLEKLKRQAEREDGQLLILPSETSEEVGALADPTLNQPSDNKDTTSIPENNTEEQKNVTEEKENAPETPATYEWSAGLVRDENTPNRSDLGILDALAKAMGVRIVFSPDVKENGYYDAATNTIYVATDVPVRFVTGHEFLHRMRDIAPEAYEKFKASVVEFMGAIGFRAAKTKKRKLYAKAVKQGRVTDMPTKEIIEEEVVADFAGKLIANFDIFEQFVERHKDDNAFLRTLRSVMQHIRNFFKGLKHPLKAETKKCINLLNELIEASAKAVGEGIDITNQEAITRNSLRTLDAPYLEAVERGDMETAQRLVEEAARLAGYTANTEYQGSQAFNGAAPTSNGYYGSKVERKKAWDNGDYEGTMSLGDYIDNAIDTNDLEWQITDRGNYRRAEDYTKESIDNVNNTIKSGNRKITIYRAVPKTIEENAVRNGDWVTPSRKYAEYHIGLQDWDGGRIIEQKVDIDDIWWNGDDINEWGYDDGSNYGYRNTPNNRKLLDPVTYDDNGNVIPLSERFNPRKSDIRYSLADIATSVKDYDSANGTELYDWLNFIESGSIGNNKTQFYIANTGKILNAHNIKGKINVTRRAVNDKRHTNNIDHKLDVMDWAFLVATINNPILITRYKNEPNSYRIYTIATINGKNICAGVDVNASNGVEITKITTAFGRDINKVKSSNVEEVIYEERNAAEQISGSDNSHLYAQLLSIDKDNASVSEKQNNFSKVRYSLRGEKGIENLHKAADTIRKWVANDTRNKSFTIELPSATIKKVRKKMGRDFNSHNITANGIAHAYKNHGENGKKLTDKSIPIRKEDLELIPYIMTAPSYVEKGTTKNGRDSVRYYKNISDGYVVVIEKELDNSADDLETINMWAELSDVSNASKTLNRTSETPTISRSDIAKIQKDAENAIVKEQNKRYSLRGSEKSLVGMHNLSLEKLEKVIKMGGLANPSVAILDIDKSDHEDYGDYSLILTPNMVDAKLGRNAGTWAGDAWTPTYPPIVKRIAKSADISRFFKDISKMPDAMSSRVRLDWDSFLEGRSAAAMAYWFLFDKGVAPELQYIPAKYPESLVEQVSTATNGSFSLWRLSPEQRAACVDAYIASKYNGNKEEYEAELQEKIARLQAFAKSAPREIVRKKAAQDLADINEYGFDYDKISDFVRDVERDNNNKGKVDVDSTIRTAQEYIEQNNLQEDFDTWKNDIQERYGVGEYIFNGYTNSGDRKWLPHTLENASKWMKQQGREGSVATFPSFGVFVATAIPRMTSLESIRKRKNLLGKDRQEFEDFKDKWEKVYFELGNKLQPDAKSFDDYGWWRLIEAVGTKNPQAHIKQQYGIELSEEDVNKLNELVDAIRTNYPARYFETKFERPLQLNDFTAAVVPSTIPADVEKALRSAYIDVYKYDKDVEGSRREATLEATDKDYIRFSLRDNTPFYSNADLAENNTMHSVDITPAMRNSVMQGQPLFSLRQPTAEEMTDIKAERETIEREAKANGTWLKAPNGQSSNLTPEQWVNVRTSRFKEWFGDWENDPENASKVVDANGEPIPVYHGTPNIFTAFDKNKRGSSTDRGIWGNGFYFSESSDYADTYAKRNGVEGRTMVLFLNVKHPLFVNLKSGGNEGAMYFTTLYGKYFTDEVFEDMYKVEENMARAQEGLSNEMINDGYDGIIVEYSHPTIADEYVVFEPNQIKSATDNVGTFDANTPDIRFSLRLPEYQERFSQLTEEYKALDKNDAKSLVDFRARKRTLVEEYWNDFARALGADVDARAIDSTDNPEVLRPYYDMYIERVRDGRIEDEEMTFEEFVEDYNKDEDMIAGHIYDSNIIFVDMAKTDKYTTTKAFTRFFIHEYAHAIIEGRVSEQELIDIWNENANTEFGKSLEDGYRGETPIELGDEVLAYTISGIGNADIRPLLNYIEGDEKVSENDVLKVFGNVLPLNAEKAKQLLKIIKNGYREKGAGAAQEGTQLLEKGESKLSTWGGGRRPNGGYSAGETYIEDGRRVTVIDEDFSIVEDLPEFDESPRYSLRDLEDELTYDNLSAMNKTSRKILKTIQDNMVDINRLQEALKKAGVPINDLNDFYNAIDTANAKAQYRYDKYFEEYAEPLLDLMSGWEQSLGLTYDDICDYLLAKHSIERHDSGLNALNPNDDAVWGRKNVEKIVADFEAKVPADEVNRLWAMINTINDRNLDILLQGGIKTPADIQMAKSHNWKYYVPLKEWAWEDEGFVDPSEYYDTMVGRRNGNIKGKWINKAAKGRTSKPANPLPHMFMAGSKAFSFVEHNKAMVALYNLLLDANEKLGDEVKGAWTISQRYYVRAANGVWEEKSAKEIPANEFDAYKAEMVEIAKLSREMRKAYANARKLEKAGNMQDALLERMRGDNINAEIKNRKANLNITIENPQAYHPNERIASGKKEFEENRDVGFYVNGQYITIEFTNSRYPAAINKVSDVKMRTENSGVNRVINAIKWATRFKSKTSTTYNPAFMLTNFLRDAGFATYVHLVDKEHGNFLGYIGALGTRSGAINRGLKGTARPLSKEEMGDLNLLNKGDRAVLTDKYGWRRVNDTLFKWFLENGAPMGFSYMKDTTNLEKELRKKLRRMRGKYSTAQQFKNILPELLQWAERMSQNVELSNRFATFVASLDKGESVGQAVSNSRNFTLNFNKKGDVTGVFSALYAFFNPFVQGLAQFAKVSAKNWQRSVPTLAAIATLGYLMNMWLESKWGDDDGDEDKATTTKVADWLKRGYIVIPMSQKDGGVIRIPLPQQIRTFFAFGSALYDYQSGKLDGKGLRTDLANSFLNDFTYGFTEGGDWIRAIIPSVGQPIYDLAVNKDAWGREVYRESEVYPKSEMGKRNTSEWAKDVTRALNTLTGGNKYKSGKIDINPDVMQYLVEQSLGGAGTFGRRTIEFIESIPKDSQVEFELQNIPMLGSLMYSVNPESGYEDYSKYQQKFSNEASGFEKKKYKEGYISREEYEKYLAQKKVFTKLKNNLIKPYSDVLNDLEYNTDAYDSVNYELRRMRNLINRVMSEMDWDNLKTEKATSDVMSIIDKYAPDYQERITKIITDYAKEK